MSEMCPLCNIPYDTHGDPAVHQLATIDVLFGQNAALRLRVTELEAVVARLTTLGRAMSREAENVGSRSAGSVTGPLDETMGEFLDYLDTLAAKAAQAGEKR